MAPGAASADPLPANDLPVPSLPVPSPPPAQATTVDGWLLTLSASGETQTLVPPPDPGTPPSEKIVGGLFVANLQAPKGAKAPTPSGTIEVGYKTQCIPNGMMAAMMTKAGAVDIPVLKEDFTGTDPTVTVANFHIPLSCMGTMLIRSYAILTRTSNAVDSVVAYYGVPIPAV
jgi:hypothetical protein